MGEEIRINCPWCGEPMGVNVLLTGGKAMWTARLDCGRCQSMSGEVTGITREEAYSKALALRPAELPVKKAWTFINRRDDVKCPWCGGKMEPRISLIGAPMAYMGGWYCPHCRSNSSEIYHDDRKVIRKALIAMTEVDPDA